MPIQRIASFTVNHDVLKPGIYLSRVDGDISTYDLRTRTPNAGDYMSNLAMHSVEHMFATFIRNNPAIGKDVIYFGPMGCQTGFYLLVRNQPAKLVLAAVVDTLQKILAYGGPVFGASSRECGNYQNLSLTEAKIECLAYLQVLMDAPNIDFQYPEAEQ